MDQNCNRRDIKTGLYLHISKDVPSDLRNIFIRFARWIRKNFDFPIKVNAYIQNTKNIYTKDTHEPVSANIYLPYDLQKSPHIKIAVGDFYDLIKEKGEFSAICAELCSLAHEIIHYQQWQNGNDMDSSTAKRANEIQAKRKSTKLIQDYIDQVDEEWMYE